MPDPSAQPGTRCAICTRMARRSHGGVLVCPYCDLNEPTPTAPTPSAMPRKRLPGTQEVPVGDEEEPSHG